MSIIDALASSAGASTPLAEVLNKGCHPIGGVYRLDYGTATVLTDDHRKTVAGGIPLGAFLLAAATKATESGLVLDEEEIVLLRVKGTAGLFNERSLEETRAAVVRDSIELDQPFESVADPLTRAELQQSAFECEVLGTFYMEGPDIVFGSDIENVVSSARYRTYLPGAEVLSWLASYPNRTNEGLVIGKVRLSSTRRLATKSQIADADVRIDIEDFISKKTAVFGMTRTGKSNTIKMLVTAISRYASEKKEAIGQLIFDPQGEYANPNPQDGTALRLLGDDSSQVAIYKMDPKSGDPMEKPLRINFLNVELCESAWSLIQLDVLNSASSGTQYLAGFRSVDMIRPDPMDFQASAKFGRYLLAMFGLLHKGGVQGQITDGQKAGFEVKMKGSAADAAGSALSWASPTTGRGGSTIRVGDTSQAFELYDWVCNNLGTVFTDKSGKAEKDPALKSWADHSEFQDLVKGITGGMGAVASVKRVRPFHDSSATSNVAEQIWDDMVNGRLAIVDLSKGNQSVAKTMSERIVTHLVDQANSRFISGDGTDDDLVPFQIVVEEAHNLFERGAKEVDANPWVRLSKEAAKYKIGLVYATQEVTSVDTRILSNTANFLVAHLNSEKETRELSGYYDFKTWADSLRRCEDKGFVRMKTYSSKYIVPVQIVKFDHGAINVARLAAGLKAL